MEMFCTDTKKKHSFLSSEQIIANKEYMYKEGLMLKLVSVFEPMK